MSYDLGAEEAAWQESGTQRESERERETPSFVLSTGCCVLRPVRRVHPCYLCLLNRYTGYCSPDLTRATKPTLRFCRRVGAREQELVNGWTRWSIPAILPCLLD
jgi:hypothetical protein